MRFDSSKVRLLQGEKTQSEMAEKIGITRTWYSTILSKGSASPSTIIKIAKALGVNPQEIVKED